MTDRQVATEVWGSVEDFGDSGVRVEWLGAVGDKNPEYSVEVTASRMNLKHAMKLVRVAESHDLELSIESRDGRAVVVLR